MQLSKEAIEEFKQIFEKKYGKKLSDKEAYESASNLLNFYKALYDCVVKEEIKKEKLKKHPRGFHLDDGIYNCLICYRQVTGKEGWWDLLGPKCLSCQRAIDKKVIPWSVCSDRDSWYAMWELNSKFSIKHQAARKMIREGKLKARVIKDREGREFFYVFLKRENKLF